MEIKKKYRCGNWMVLLFLCTVLALTGCMRREDVFLEEITSEEEPAEGKAIEDALAYANVAASLSTEKFGAQTGMPTAEEVETALKILIGESVEKVIPVEMELIPIYEIWSFRG